jgi:hypothetical protein
LSDLFFEGLKDAFVELRDGDGVAWRHGARGVWFWRREVS